jgi:hypothetical protein
MASVKHTDGKHGGGMFEVTPIVADLLIARKLSNENSSRLM